MFFITGDIHGTLDIGKITEFFSGCKEKYSKEDYLLLGSSFEERVQKLVECK